MDKKVDISFFFEVYQKYYSLAEKKKMEGNYKSAKYYYYNAAEVLYKIAKYSTPELKKTRINNAKSLEKIAESLPNENVIFTYDNSKRDVNGKAANQNEKENNEFEASEIPNVHFSDIVGLDDVKNTIKIRMIIPFIHQKEYEQYGKKIGGGVLLYGPPGTGKTMIAKAIACEVGAHFYAVKSSDIVSKWVGESEKNIASLFESANKQDKAIIFIDEMDSLFAKRGKDSNNDSRVNEFLQQMDGFSKKNSNLLFLGATNRPWDIDDAALRSGRFSEKIYVPLPDFESRKYLFKLHLKDNLIDSTVDFDKLSNLTDGFSGADIAECCDKAKNGPLMKCIETGAFVPVTEKDVEIAIDDMRKNINVVDVTKYIEYAKK